MQTFEDKMRRWRTWMADVRREARMMVWGGPSLGTTSLSAEPGRGGRGAGPRPDAQKLTCIQSLEGGAPPDRATTAASGSLDELAALHGELGVFTALDNLDPRRKRDGIDDRLLLRTLSVPPFLECHLFTGAAQLFQEPAIPPHLGWPPFQVRMGDGERHRSPHGRQREFAAVRSGNAPRRIGRHELGGLAEAPAAGRGGARLAAHAGFGSRQHIEHGTFRELKEGWGLEEERWGRNLQVQRGRAALTCLAFNTAWVYLSYLTQRGPKLAAQGIRRIRRLRRPYDDQLGHSPVAIYLGHDHAVFPVEKLPQLIGRTTRESFRHAVARRSPGSPAKPRGP